MGRAYAVDEIFSVVIPTLQHGNDGLIFTRVNTPYTPGTDENMYVTPVLQSVHFWLPCRSFFRSVALTLPAQLEVEATVRKFNRLQAFAPLPTRPRTAERA
jgi:hypothetical protein